MSEQVHVVQEKETIEHIALKYGVNLTQLKRMNKLCSVNNPILVPGDCVLVSPRGNESAFIDVDSDDAFDEQLIEYNYKLEGKELADQYGSDENVPVANSELLRRRKGNIGSLRNLAVNAVSPRSGNVTPRGGDSSGQWRDAPGIPPTPMTPGAIRNQLATLNNRLVNSTKREMVLHKKLKAVTDSYNNLRQEVRFLVAAVQEKNAAKAEGAATASNSSAMSAKEWVLFATMQTLLVLLLAVCYIVMHDWHRITS
jgi:hypothetical protein